MSKPLVTLAVLLTTALSACASTQEKPAPDYKAMGPSMNAKRYATLQKIAAKDLDCAAEKLQHEYLGENQHVMRGCDTNGVYELRCMMGSCVWLADLRGRASFDLNCQRTQIKITVIGPTTRGASGCGKRATYQMSPVDGSWILNSSVSEEQAPAKSDASGKSDI